MSENASPARATVSAFIVCCNEERQIRRCLESVAWCDEIVIVDSGSTDSTLAICGEFTNKIAHRTWTGYVEQKRHALSLCTSAWVLNLDADEEVSPTLRDELTSIAMRDVLGHVPHNGYYLNRVVFFLNRWWRKGGWYPEYRLRFCRRSATTWGGEDPHEKASVTGTTARCRGELFHYSFSDLTDYVRRLNTLASNAAHTMQRKGVTSSACDIITRPISRFIKFYIVKRGFREGTAGLVVALIDAYGALLKYAKLWELRACRGASQERSSKSDIRIAGRDHASE
jgi:glycosyltransferase involved in cell wall biosynthesis